MKAHSSVRWILTGLASALMAASAVPDALRVPGALMVFRHLGYPEYLLPFLGMAKLLGVAAVLAPGVPRIKEWAFAGLTFDLVGAVYSHLSVGDPPQVWMLPVMGLMLVGGAYVAHRLRLAPTPNRALSSDSGHNKEGPVTRPPRQQSTATGLS
jgi:hypothetical protein